MIYILIGLPVSIILTIFLLYWHELMKNSFHFCPHCYSSLYKIKDSDRGPVFTCLGCGKLYILDDSDVLTPYEIN